MPEWAGSGVLLFAAAAAWSMTTATAAGSSALPLGAWILATGLVLAASLVAATRWPSLVLGVVVVGAIVLLAWSPASVLQTGPRQGPLGYANATAAFYGVAIIAALLLFMSVRSRGARLGAAAAAVGFVPVVLLARSWAVALLLPSVVIVALAVDHIRGARAAVIVCAMLFFGALLLTQIVGAGLVGGGSGLLDRTIRASLSSDRVILWREATTIMVDEPLLGVGSGNFSSRSPFARSDPDRGWAHHEFLQAGAESGLPGYVLTVALVVWGFAALWSAADGGPTAIAAAGLAFVGTHATIDYVLHFPPVAMALAVVVGTGIGMSSTQGRATPSSSRVAA